MKFEVGNKVLFKKDNQKGIVIKVNSPYMFTVLTDDGFEIMVSIDNLVKVVSGSDKINSYGTFFFSKDSEVPLRKPQKNQKRRNTLKVDLHIELLSDNYHYLDNFEIVQIQINELSQVCKYHYLVLSQYFYNIHLFVFEQFQNYPSNDNYLIIIQYVNQL